MLLMGEHLVSWYLCVQDGLARAEGLGWQCGGFYIQMEDEGRHKEKQANWSKAAHTSLPEPPGAGPSAH